MRNTIKMSGVLAFAVILGLTMTACPGGSNGAGGGFEAVSLPLTITVTNIADSHDGAEANLLLFQDFAAFDLDVGPLATGSATITSGSNGIHQAEFEMYQFIAARHAINRQNGDENGSNDTEEAPAGIRFFTVGSQNFFVVLEVGGSQYHRGNSEASMSIAQGRFSIPFAFVSDCDCVDSACMANGGDRCGHFGCQCQAPASEAIISSVTAEATDNPDEINVTWEAEHAEQFEVKWTNYHQESESNTYMVQGGATSFLITGLTPGATYRISVRATNESMGENWTDWVDADETVTLADAASDPEAVVSNVTAKQSSEDPASIIVSWEAEDADRFEVEWVNIEDANDTGSAIVFGIEHTIEGLTLGATYRISVRATNESMGEDWTDWVDADGTVTLEDPAGDSGVGDDDEEGGEDPEL